jgi:hypothetical protein
MSKLDRQSGIRHPSAFQQYNPSSPLCNTDVRTHQQQSFDFPSALQGKSSILPYSLAKIDNTPQ